MNSVITIYAQSDLSNQKFNVYVFEGSSDNLVSFTKGVENNTTFSVEQEKESDGTTYLSLVINDLKKVTKTVNGSFNLFTAQPEEGYLVHQFNLEDGNLFIFNFINPLSARSLFKNFFAVVISNFEMQLLAIDSS